MLQLNKPLLRPYRTMPLRTLLSSSRPNDYDPYVLYLQGFVETAFQLTISLTRAYG